MKMSYENLLNSGKIKKVEKSEADFSLSERDLISAKRNFDFKDFDWAFNIAYNSVLQASRTLMFFLGYKTSGGEQHKSVFEFLYETSGISKNHVEFFDKVRKKRDNIVYRDAFTIGEKEARELIDMADIFVQEIRTFVQNIRTGVER